MQPTDDTKDLIKIELEDELNVEDVTFEYLLNRVYIAKLKIDIEFEREDIQDNYEFDRFRIRIMEIINRKLSYLGRKTNFRISLMNRDQWSKEWVFSYIKHSKTLFVSFYIIFNND